MYIQVQQDNDNHYSRLCSANKDISQHYKDILAFYYWSTNQIVLIKNNYKLQRQMHGNMYGQMYRQNTSVEINVQTAKEAKTQATVQKQEKHIYRQMQRQSQG